MLQRGMTNSANAAIHLSDLALIDEVKAAAVRERGATARLIGLLAELDVRRLYLGEGCSSLFWYCTQVLRLSEHAAYGRIEAARIARKFPVVLDLLTEGAVTLTTVTLLGPLLTLANHRQVLAEARHQSKREVEHLVARLRPQPAVAEVVRKLPTPKTASVMDLLATATPGVQRAAASAASPASAPPRHVVLTPLAPDRYKVQLTVTRATHDKLRRAQDLLRHSLPNGDLAEIVDRAVTLLLADLERAKLATVERPRAARSKTLGARYIPASVRRAVWKRDGGRCAFVGEEGRCTERGFLEFHHIRPYAAGGGPTVENLELRCRAHNLHEAGHYFRGRLPLLREAKAKYTTPLLHPRARRLRRSKGSRAASDISRARASASRAAPRQSSVERRARNESFNGFCFVPRQVSCVSSCSQQQSLTPSPPAETRSRPSSFGRPSAPDRSSLRHYSRPIRGECSALVVKAPLLMCFRRGRGASLGRYSRHSRRPHFPPSAARRRSSMPGMSLAPGSRLGRYEIQSQIGSGGMGTR